MKQKSSTEYVFFTSFLRRSWKSCLKHVFSNIHRFETLAPCFFQVKNVVSHEFQVFRNQISNSLTLNVSSHRRGFCQCGNFILHKIFVRHTQDGLLHFCRVVVSRPGLSCQVASVRKETRANGHPRPFSFLASRPHHQPVFHSECKINAGQSSREDFSIMI